MALETASYIHQLVSANPPGADRVHQGDDHIRLLKAAIKATFPNITGPVTLTQAVINALPDLATPAGIISIWYGTAATVPIGWSICDGTTVARTSGVGTIATPDLRGRVVVGVQAGLYEYGTTFGQASQTLNTNSGGVHSHGGSTAAAGEHSHGGVTGSTILSEANIPAHTHGAVSSTIADAPISGAPANSIAWGTTSTPGESEYKLSASGGTTADFGRTGSTGSNTGHTHPINPDGSHSHGLTIADSAGHTHSLAAFSVVQPSGALHYIIKT